MAADWRRPGFTIPGYAAAAAQKGHELGLIRKWTPEEAREQARRGAAARWGKDRLEPKRDVCHSV